jgi:HEAT repeat protein
MKARWAVAVAALLAVAGGGVALMALRPSRIDADLRDPNPAVRAAAIRRLNGIADADRLIVSLKDEDSDVRLLSAMRLGGQRAAAPALVEALKDRHAGVRRAAAEALSRLWPVSQEALTHALTDPDPRVRAGAAYALGEAPSERDDRVVTAAQAEPLRPLLRDLLNDPDPEVRENAGEALRRIP